MVSVDWYVNTGYLGNRSFLIKKLLLVLHCSSVEILLCQTQFALKYIHKSFITGSGVFTGGGGVKDFHPAPRFFLK